MELTGRVRFARKAFFFLAVIYAVCVAIQVFFAGVATFVDPLKWQLHRNFVRVIEFIPIIMLVFGFMGRLSKSLRWQSAGLFLFIILMCATANIARSVPITGAFHPVVALAMFWLAIVIIRPAWRYAFKAD